MIMKARKDYARPTMKVVKLQQQCRILAGSGGQSFGASRSSYTHGRTDGGSGTGDEVWE